MGKSDRDRPTKDSRVRGIAFHRAFEILFVGTYVHDQWEPLLCMLPSFWPLRITFDMDLTWIILSALAFTSNIIPLLWQIEHRNSGPICLTFWVIVLNLNNFINAIIWRNDAINRAPAWCDLTSKIEIGGPIGLLAANVCIVRFLARVVSPKATMITSRDQRIRAIVDYSICLGLPIFVMATHIVYQPIRYGISKTLGCQYAFAISWPTFVLWMIWSPILAFVAAAYGVYVLYRLMQHRQNFARLLANADSALTTSRFMRLGLLSGTYILFTVPMSIYQFILQLKVGGEYIPYDWDRIHLGYKRGAVYYSVFVERASFESYLPVISACLVFIFFGFSNDSLAFYARWVGKVRRMLSRKRASEGRTPITPANDKFTLVERSDSSSERNKDPEHLFNSDDYGKYSGPFADSIDGQPAQGLQVSVMRYESVV